MSHINQKQTFDFNLIDHSIELLIKPPLCMEEFIEISKTRHKVKDALLPILTEMSNDINNDLHLPLAQALFESGYLNHKAPNDSNLSQLLNNIYAVYIMNATSTINEIHSTLTKHGYLGLQGKDVTTSTFYPYGENQLSAYTFKVKDRTGPYCTDINRQVLVMKCPSPMFAFIIDTKHESTTPFSIQIVKLKCNYDDPDALPELVKNGFTNIPSASDINCSTLQVVTKLRFDTMRCFPMGNLNDISLSLLGVEQFLCSVREIDVDAQGETI